MPTSEEIKLLIRKYALQNAVKYDKTPQAGAVMGKVMAHPELRPHAREITALVNEILIEIDQMTPESRAEKLQKIAPELLEELKEKKEPEKGLPPLEINDQLVMRFAPNPNGPPTLGSARGIVVNSEYTRKYNGKLIIRFDDTDPATKRPMLEAYKWYLEDCEWLGAKPDEVVIASDRLQRYYEVAEELIRRGGAYVCFCEEVGDKYCVWPLLDFESAVEDHLLGTTLIIRSKDLIDSERRQRYVYEYMGWTYPKTMHWGRVQIYEFGKLSTSGIKKAIAEGKYIGWDDPRLPTLRAMRRRGIRPEALRKFMIDLGLGETDISLSLDTLYAENRKIIDPVANRYFFVWNPVELEVEGAQPKIAKAPLHPSRGGVREIPAGTTVLVCRNDVDTLKAGEKLRLKDLYNIRITSIAPLKAEFIGTDMDLVKKEKARIIHWVPLEGLKVKVLSPDGEYTGIGERGMEKELDKVVQFERFGFVRIDSASGDEVVAYYTHK